MKKFLALLLVTLALCCYEANAGLVCAPVLRESTMFLGGTQALLAAELAKYNAPPEAVEAKMQVKRCVDEISTMKTVLLLNVMKNILAGCMMTK